LNGTFTPKIKNATRPIAYYRMRIGLFGNQLTNSVIDVRLQPLIIKRRAMRVDGSKRSNYFPNQAAMKLLVDPAYKRTAFINQYHYMGMKIEMMHSPNRVLHSKS
jgi:hypothetical protein